MKGYAGENNFTYSTYEKENDFGIGVLDAHARMYDPITPRFWQIDPLSDLLRQFSPTVYANGNPLRFIDPDGMQSQTIYDFNGIAHTVGDDEQTSVYKAPEEKEKNKASNVNTSKRYDALPTGTNVTSGIYAGTKLDEVVVAGKKSNAFDQAINSFDSGSYNRRYFPRNPNDHNDYSPFVSFFVLHAFEMKYTTPIGLYFGAGYVSLRGQGKFYLISNPPLMSTAMSFNASTTGWSASLVAGNPLSETTTIYDYGEWSRSISAQHGGYGIGTSEGRAFDNSTGFSKPLVTTQVVVC